jgi:hypothetical protein
MWRFIRAPPKWRACKIYFKPSSRLQLTLLHHSSQRGSKSINYPKLISKVHMQINQRLTISTLQDVVCANQHCKLFYIVHFFGPANFSSTGTWGGSAICMKNSARKIPSRTKSTSYGPLFLQGNSRSMTTTLFLFETDSTTISPRHRMLWSNSCSSMVNLLPSSS